MTSTAWSTHQLAEFVASVSACETEAAAARATVDRAAEALDADVAAIVCGGELIAAVGYAEVAQPAGELTRIRPGAPDSWLNVPGVGQCPAAAAALAYPHGAMLVLARSGGLTRQEAGLLRGMARTAAMTMRMLSVLDRERAAREESQWLAKELAASRARIVATADQTRRRIERDLHDGAQQRLITLALQLRAIQARVPPQQDQLTADLDRVVAGLTNTLDELREYARGIHPAILAQGGLGPSLKALARRSPIPVRLDTRIYERLPGHVEITAYYVISESLANAAKHSKASSVEVEVEIESTSGVLRLDVRDDGIGGADQARGSGLIGLKDRVEAIGGTFTMKSRPGEGTRLLIELPAPANQADGAARPRRAMQP